jgi:hypothetical protein
MTMIGTLFMTICDHIDQVPTLRLSRIGIKPEGFYFIARIPNNKIKQKKLKKKFGVLFKF